MAYIHSMLPREGNQMDTQENARIYQSIEEQIQKEGNISIQKSLGLFIGKM